MKSTLLSVAVFFASTGALAQAQAQNAVVKECSVTMKQLESDKTVDMTMQVTAKGNNSFSALITQTVDGVTGFFYNNVVEVSEENVRADLSAQSDVYELDLNQAERLIVHAMLLSEEPVFQGAFSTGIDLKKVRSAKMYTIGQKTNMGSATIVEARDVDNQVLGSFLGGFLVSPCK